MSTAFGRRSTAVGQPVSSGLIDGTTLSGYSNGSTGTLTISGIGNFRYLVFTALPSLTNQPEQERQFRLLCPEHHCQLCRPECRLLRRVRLRAGLGRCGPVRIQLRNPVSGRRRALRRRAPEPIVVNDEECSTGQGTNNQSCKIQFTEELATTIAGEDVEGTIKVVGHLDCRRFPRGVRIQRREPGAEAARRKQADRGNRWRLDLGFTLDRKTRM